MTTLYLYLKKSKKTILIQIHDKHNWDVIFLEIVSFCIF